MSFIFWLFIIVVVLPYLVSALLRWFAADMVRRKTRQMNDAFARAAGIDPEELRRQQAEKERAEREGGWTSPTPKPKKFDSEDGEYVRFNDMEVDNSASTEPQTGGNASADRSNHGEQQVEDVSWEDID